MSVYKIDPLLPLSTRITTLNDMVLEVNGKTVQGQFDKNELDQLYTDYDFARKFLRDQLLGNTYLNYTNWTHYYAETGYSIWKISPSRYKHNTSNQLYMDNKALDFRGEALAETASFDAVYDYLDDAYVDDTTDAGSGLTTIEMLSAIAEYQYIGDASVFTGIDYTWSTHGNGYTLVVEYWNGSSWVALGNSNYLVDNTSDWNTDGLITWTAPLDWATVSVNGSTPYYFVRVSSTTAATTVAYASSVKPSSSIRGILSLTSTDVQNEDWSWCSYNGSIYVTIRNAGASAYEGNYFITSSSSVANLQNFFAHNHAFKADYEDSSYASGSGTAVESGVSYGDLVYISDEYTFDLADANVAAKRCIGILLSPGVVKLSDGLAKNVNTVGNSDIVPGDVLYLSETGGKVSRTAPDPGGERIQQRVGVALSYENSGNVVDMVFRPEYV